MADIKRLFNRYFGADEERNSAWRDFSSTIRRYNAWWPCPDGATGPEADAARAKRVQNTGQLASDYYDCVSPSYEQGWGQHFHYAPIVPGMSIKQCIEDFERLHGEMTGFKSGMKVLDVGYGLGGPARSMARQFGCKVVGITNSDWHVERGTALIKEAGMMDRVEIVKGDFHVLPPNPKARLS